MDVSILNKPLPPWALRLNIDDAAQAVALLTSQCGATVGTDCRVIDGARCVSLNQMLREFSRAYKFPDYFGNNLNALQDCLSDLGWLEIAPTQYLTLIINGSSFLADESTDQLNLVLSFLTSVAEEWATPVTRGEWWDRGAVPFHFVFQLAASGHKQLVSLPVLDFRQTI